MDKGQIDNVVKVYIPLPYQKEANLIPESGAHYTDAAALVNNNTSYPLIEGKNVYIVYKFLNTNSPTVYGTVYAAGKTYNHMNLIPMYDQYTTNRCFCLIMEQITNDIRKKWWDSAVQFGDAEYSSIEDEQVVMRFSGTEYDGNDMKETRFGVILHTKEEANTYIFGEDGDDDDCYIYAAIDASSSDGVEVSLA